MKVLYLAPGSKYDDSGKFKGPLPGKDQREDPKSGQPEDRKIEQPDDRKAEKASKKKGEKRQEGGAGDRGSEDRRGSSRFDDSDLIKVDYKKLIHGDPAQNPEIHAGDRILIAERPPESKHDTGGGIGGALMRLLYFAPIF